MLKPKQEEALFLFTMAGMCHLVSSWVWGVNLLPLLKFMFDFKLKRTTSPQVKRSAVLVVSPLVSLMVDHVSGVQKRGVPVAVLSGNTGKFNIETSAAS